MMEVVKYSGHIEKHPYKTKLERKANLKSATGKQCYRWEGNTKRWTKSSLAESTVITRDTVLVSSLFCSPADDRHICDEKSNRLKA